MEKKIIKAYRRDCVLVILSIVFLWLALLGTMSAIRSLESGKIILFTAVGSGIIAGTAATVSLLALLSHLRQNRQKVYSEDIYYLEQNLKLGNKE